MNPRAPRWFGVSAWLAVASLTALPALAQDNKFTPVISIGQVYTDNVAYVGTGDSSGSSDSSTNLSISLPYQRLWSTGSLRVSYRPGVQKYVDSSTLDNDTHDLSLNLTSQPSRGTSIGLTSSYSISQTQGNPESLDEDDFFLTPRTERRLARVGLNLGTALKGLWTWSGNVSLSDSRYKAIADFSTGLSSIRVEDRSSYSAGVNFGRSISPVSSVGFGYSVQLSDQSQSGNDLGHSLNVTARRQIDRQLSLNASAGAVFRKTDVDDGSGMISEKSQTQFQASLGLSRTYDNVDLLANISHRPAVNGAQSGASTNSSLSLGLAGRFARRWGWGSAARIARRDPVDDLDPVIDTYSIGGNVQRNFSRVIGVSLNVNYADQSGETDLDSASFFTAGLNLLFTPLGRTELGR